MKKSPILIVLVLLIADHVVNSQSVESSSEDSTTDQAIQNGDDVAETVVSSYHVNPTIESYATERVIFLDKYSYADNRFENEANVKCQMEAKCELLQEKTCLGAKISYTHTSMALSGFANQQQARDSLNDLLSLQLVPRCWSVIQPFICAVLFPQCHNSTIQLPSKEMCHITKGPCNIIQKHGNWPHFLLCKENYPSKSKCKTSSKDLAFNTSGVCAPPLVATERDKLWYNGFKGCGVQCSHPLFTDSEHTQFQYYSFLMALISICICSFTVLTYLVDWRSANQYPGIIIFYINVCYLCASIGFMLQFHPSLRSNITCHPDGTRRLSGPSGGDISCVVTFIMVYYFLMAASIWFVILGYAFHINYKSFVVGKCDLTKKASYFHLAAWSSPVVPTIAVMGLAEVEGDPVVGICFLSQILYVRIVFLLIPLVATATAGTFFIVKGLRRLLKVKLESSHIISDNANKKIRKAIVRLSLFVVFVYLFLFTSIYFHAYIFAYEAEWLVSLKEFILCTSKITKPNDYKAECKVKNRPSLNVYYLHLFSFVVFGFAISSFFWTTSTTISVWKRFIRRLAGTNVEEPSHYSKREVIGQAFAKRKNLNVGGRISITLRSMHSDPAGLTFDMNSTTSADMSSAWVAAIPHLMNRRGAVAGESVFHKRRNSIGSICGVSKRLSIDSSVDNSGHHLRRHSLDSQISFHVSDVERRVALHTAARFGGRRKQRNYMGSKRHRRFSFRKTRRASNTSDDSNQGSMIFGQSEPCAYDSLFTTMMKMINTNSSQHSYSHKQDDGNYPTPTAAEGGRASKTAAEGGSRETTGTAVKATVGVQTSLESIEQPPRCIMVEKGCQVSTPQLRKAALDADLSGSNSSLSSYRMDQIKV